MSEDVVSLRIPTKPGKILLEEFIKPLKITYKDFAKRCGVSLRSINAIITGNRSITPEMAIRLSVVLATTPQFWLNLQMNVDLYNARVKLLK